MRVRLKDIQLAIEHSPRLEGWKVTKDLARNTYFVPIYYVRNSRRQRVAGWTRFGLEIYQIPTTRNLMEINMFIEDILLEVHEMSGSHRKQGAD